MKKPDLASVLAAATLFLALGAINASAQDDKTPPPPPADMPGATWHAKMLERFDANKDGKLDDAEKATARETMSKEMRARMEKNPRFLAMADTNHDGKISDEEWTAARGKFQHLREARMEHMEHRLRADFHRDRRSMKPICEKCAGMRDPEFRRGYLLGKYDKNNNGKLDPEERAAMKADMELRIRTRMEKQLARLKAIDANGDGKISDEEWAAAKAKFKELHKGMRHDGPPPMAGEGPDTPPPPPPPAE